MNSRLAPVSTPKDRPISSRLPALDGLRGVATILVVLSHGWILRDYADIDANGWIRPFFRNGNAAVTVFLVAAGFLTYRALSRSGQISEMRTAPLLLRRVLRVGPTLWVVIAATLVMASMDPTDTNSKQVNRDSAIRLLTYTYNWLVQDNLVAGRPDFGHLWFLSVEMQAFLLVTALVYVLRRRPQWLLATLGVLFVVLVMWRFHSYATENVFKAFNRTTTRMDAFVIGTFTAVALQFVPRGWRPHRMLAPGLAALLVPILFWCDANDHFLRWGGTAMELVVAAFILVVSLAPSQEIPGLSRPSLVWLGRQSLVIYVWQYPVFWFVQRHTMGWAWVPKALVALLALSVLTALTVVLVERHVTRFLARPGWAPLLANGVGPAVRSAAQEWVVASPHASRLVNRFGARTPNTTVPEPEPTKHDEPVR